MAGLLLQPACKRVTGGQAVERKVGLIPLAEYEGFQLVRLLNYAAHIFSKRAQVSQRIWVDVVADHARWEYVAYLVKPKLVRRSEASPIIEWRMITR